VLDAQQQGGDGGGGGAVRAAAAAAAVAAVVESVAQQQAAAMQWGVRPLVFAETTVGLQRAASCSRWTDGHQILAAAVRFWFLATPSLVRAPE